MGSPLSPIIADLGNIEDNGNIEEGALERLGTQVAFYYRYVDIIMAVPQYLINKIAKVFNS